MTSTSYRGIVHKLKLKVILTPMFYILSHFLDFQETFIKSQITRYKPYLITSKLSEVKLASIYYLDIWNADVKTTFGFSLYTMFLLVIKELLRDL